MDAVHVNVPLRTGKKMKKRKELDALVANSIAKRSCTGGVGVGNCGHHHSIINKRSTTAGNGISSQDQLLSESTDEQETYWNNCGADTVNTKRSRNLHITRRRTLLSLMRACTALLVFTCVVATITVMWLLIDVREQITSLRSELDQVVASNQGVPEALQKCHSVSRGLQQNQTQLAIQLNNFRQQLENFTQQFNDIKNGLNQVQQRLKENPDLINIPQQVSILQNSVAEFGGQMKDVTTTVQSLKEQTTKFTSTNNDIVQNMTAIQATVSQILQNNVTINNPNNQKVLLDEKQEINNLISQLRTNVSHINETLTQGLQWLVDDQHKDHQIIIGLQEMNQSIFARVSNLEDICSKTDHNQVENLAQINNLSQNISTAVSKFQQTDTAVLTLQAQVHDLNTKYSDQNVTLNELKDALLQLSQTMPDNNSNNNNNNNNNNPIPSKETPSSININTNNSTTLSMLLEPTVPSNNLQSNTMNSSIETNTTSIQPQSQPQQPVIQQPNVKPKTLSMS